MSNSCATSEISDAPLRTPDADLLNAWIDLHPFAALRVDRGCGIHFRNRRAIDILPRHERLFSTDNNRLSIADGTANRLLTTGLGAPPSSGQFTVRVADEEQRLPHSLVVRALPCVDHLAGKNGASGNAEATDFLVSFRLVDQGVPLFDPERLVTDLDLTPREAEAAAALAEGYTVREIAGKLGLGMTTARWHLDNARRKLGCASQKDLVRTVLLVSV